MKVLIKLFCLICKLTITVKQMWEKVNNNYKSIEFKLLRPCSYKMNKTIFTELKKIKSYQNCSITCVFFIQLYFNAFKFCLFYPSVKLKNFNFIKFCLRKIPL